jgi:hypothetical protein
MIAEYLTRRDAEIYASELTQFYGPDVHFDVVVCPIRSSVGAGRDES